MENISDDLDYIHTLFKMDVQLQYRNQLRLERKIKLVAIKGGGCAICRYNACVSALDFHHVDPLQKAFDLSQSNLYNTAWETIIAEAKKTVCLCRNCHTEVHHGMHKPLEAEWRKDMENVA